jgi:hypothetical protein
MVVKFKIERPASRSYMNYYNRYIPATTGVFLDGERVGVIIGSDTAYMSNIKWSFYLHRDKATGPEINESDLSIYKFALTRRTSFGGWMEPTKKEFKAAITAWLEKWGADLLKSRTREEMWNLRKIANDERMGRS